MIPKIEFVYSSIYDSMWPKPKKKLSENIIDNYLNSIEKIWKKEGGKILSEISKISGLKWKEEKIKCYLLSGGRCFSYPLTITYFKDKNRFIDILTHELIHQIQIQYADWDKWKFYFFKNYGKYNQESLLTKGHIFLNAVHYKILKKLYGKKRLNLNIKRHDKWADYKRAWEIVKEEGYENIIKNFKDSQK